MTDVIQHADVRMIQARNGLGFAFEALLTNRIGGQMRWQNLDCDRTFQPRIPRAIHLPHPACAQRREDFIRSKPCAWTERHKWCDYNPVNFSECVQTKWTKRRAIRRSGGPLAFQIRVAARLKSIICS